MLDVPFQILFVKQANTNLHITQTFSELSLTHNQGDEMNLPLISTILLLGILAVPSINSHLLVGKKLLLTKKLLGEKENCHVFYEDKTTPHCSTTYERVGLSIPVFLKPVSFCS